MSLAPEVRRGGGLPFGQVVSQWVCDPRYSTNLRTFYTILVTYADIGARDTGKGKPYRAELAAQLGVSVKTVDRTILEGECAGLFNVEKRQDPKNPNLNDASIYHLADATFWRGEWVDPLKPGQSAAQAAAEVVQARVEAKRKAGIAPKGGRRQTKSSQQEGVASPMTPPSIARGGVTSDATPGVTGDARVASLVTPNIQNPVENPLQEPQPVLPSVPLVPVPVRKANPDTPRTDGTDGGRGDQQKQEEPPATTADTTPPGRNAPPATPVVVTPGVELLLAIGAEVPSLLLSGQVLRDQGAMVTGMLVSGWTPEHLRQVIAGRPLPAPVRTTVGAVVSGRLRAAAASPPPSSVPRLPAQQSAVDGEGLFAGHQLGTPTPTPPAWPQRKAALASAATGRGPVADCEGDGGLCKRLAVPGESKCAQCLGWEMCPQCTLLRVAPHQEVCERCTEAGGGAASQSGTREGRATAGRSR